jgi:hypothetical protein
MTKQMFDEEITQDAIPYKTWEKVGEKVTGIYVGKQLNSTEDKYGKIKEEYILKQADGTYIKIGGRALSKGGVDGVDYRILFGMENVAYGNILGLKYTEDRANKKGNATKIIDIIWPTERKLDMEAVAEYEKVYGASPKVGEVNTVDSSDEEEINVDEMEM